MNQTVLDLRILKNGKLTQNVAEEQVMHYRFLLVWFFQLFAVLASYTLALFLRFEMSIPREYWTLFLMVTPIFAVCRLASYYYFRIDASSWRFASIQDLMSIVESHRARFNWHHCNHGIHRLSFKASPDQCLSWSL